MASTPSKAEVNSFGGFDAWRISSYRTSDGWYLSVRKGLTYPWDSKVKVDMLVEVGDMSGTFYKPGNIATVNATNLYERREDADPKRKHSQK
jgi:hypothetical protein